MHVGLGEDVARPHHVETLKPGVDDDHDRSRTGDGSFGHEHVIPASTGGAHDDGMNQVEPTGLSARPGGAGGGEGTERDDGPIPPTNPDERISQLGLTIPDPFPSFGSYVMAVIDGTTLYTSGHVPFDGTGLITGKLGDDLSIEQGAQAARLAALSLLATLRAELGRLSRVRQILHVTGTVNAAPHFVDHTAVIDGASDLLVDVLATRGRHARLAVGVNSLPADMALEVQAVIALHPRNGDHDA